MHKPCFQTKIQLTLIDDGQNDILQNVHFKEPWFITLWLNGQLKYQMFYEDTIMWTSYVATSKFQNCIMALIIVHHKIKNVLPPF